MSKKPAPPAQKTREKNMARRRQLILDQARRTIAFGGMDSLKLRELASDVGVTVPTIYNVVGGKADIARIIVEELVERLASSETSSETLDPSLAVENVIFGLFDLFSEDEEYFRAAYIVGERTRLFGPESSYAFNEGGLNLFRGPCDLALNAGLLKGQISTEQLVKHIYRHFRHVRQDWVHRYYDLETSRKLALTGAFLCLAADATEEYHERLLQRIAELK